MQFTTSPTATNLTCTGQPNNGLFNRVDITGSNTANANACRSTGYVEPAG